LRFEGKVVLITGGANGIGKATAVLFADEGAKVIVADTDEANGVLVVDSIVRDNKEAIFISVDVTDRLQVEALANQVVETYGRIDVLLNNAGVYARGDVISTSEDLWDKIIQVNLKGVFLCSRAVIPVMRREKKGVIINTSSSVGLHAAAPGIAAYCASKGGVTSLTKAMANDHLRDNIRVNCICPGPTDTPLLRESRSKGQLSTFIKSLPSGRLAKPEEVARVVLMLSSEEAAAITGAAVPVDMGQTAHL
jgi:NAD(P)-dependent dehydrogenase (short-subunit alcohol dehydrogenase family)